MSNTSVHAYSAAMLIPFLTSLLALAGTSQSAPSAIQEAFGIRLGAPAPNMEGLGFKRLAGQRFASWEKQTDGDFNKIVVLAVPDGSKVLMVEGTRTYLAGRKSARARCVHDHATLLAKLKRQYASLNVAAIAPPEGLSTEEAEEIYGFYRRTMMAEKISGASRNQRSGRLIFLSCTSGGSLLPDAKTRLSVSYVLSEAEIAAAEGRQPEQSS